MADPSTYIFVFVLIVQFLSTHQANIQGDVTIGPECEIDPTATIIADAGPIVLGRRCKVKANAQIIYSQLDNSTSTGKTLYIGDGNVFGPSSVVKAHGIGYGNVFESYSYVGSGVHLGSGNNFGVSSIIYAKYIGSGNVFGSKVFLGSQVIVNNGCYIAPNVHIDKNVHIPNGKFVLNSY